MSFLHRPLRHGQLNTHIRRTVNHRRTSTGIDGAVSRTHMLKQYPDLARVSGKSGRVRTKELAMQGIDRFNDALKHATEREDFGSVVNICKQLNEEGIEPSRSTYNRILSLLAKRGLLEEAWAIWNDMEESGFKADVESYNYIIQAAENVPAGIYPILSVMKDDGIKPNAITYEGIIAHHANFRNLAMCLQTLEEMDVEKITPTIRVAELIIETAHNSGMAAIALDIARIIEASSPRRLEAWTWLSILELSSDVLFAEGTQIAWNAAVKRGNLTPSEGVLVQTLNTAARHGLVELAEDALGVLKSLRIPVQDHHIAAYIEVYVVAGQIKKAFELLNTIDDRYSLARPTDLKTLYAIQQWVSQDESNLDSAWNILADMHAEKPSNMTIAPANAVIAGAIQLDDMQRAIGMYQELEMLGLKPDATTLNVLLDGCIQLSHRELADKLIAEARKASIDLNADTYDRMVELCLKQSSYEDAFYFLEDMKRAGFKPSYRTYETLVRTTFMAYDARWKSAMEELKENYGPSRSRELQHELEDLMGAMTRQSNV